MARHQQVVRAFRLLQLLGRPAGATLDQLADELGVERRTVYRDLRALEELRLPIWADEEQRPKRWHVRTQHPGGAGMSFSAEELLALSLAARREDGLTAELLSGIRDRAGPLAGSADRARADAMSRRVSVSRATNGEGDGIAALHGLLWRAIAEHRELLVHYRSRSPRGPGPRRVQPVGLAVRSQGSYLLARDADADDRVRKYKLARIASAAPTGRRFPATADVDPDDMFATSFGVHDGPVENFVIEFSPKAAPFVEERQWHATQAVRRLPAGGLELRFRASGRPEVKAWAQSFGADALLIEPEELAREIAADARRVLLSVARRSLSRTASSDRSTSSPRRKA